jgi:hypothetical protein
VSRKSRAKPPSPFRYFNSAPEVIRLVVLMYIRFPLSLRNVEDLLFERGIDICHETVRLWWNRFGPGAVKATWRGVFASSSFPVRLPSGRQTTLVPAKHRAEAQH